MSHPDSKPNPTSLDFETMQSTSLQIQPKPYGLGVKGLALGSFYLSLDTAEISNRWIAANPLLHTY